MDWAYEEGDIKSLDLSEIMKTEKERMLTDQGTDGSAKWNMVKQAELHFNLSSN